MPFPHHLDGNGGYAVLLMDPHSGVQDVDKPMPYSTIVFRDPDDIQLELFHMNAP